MTETSFRVGRSKTGLGLFATAPIKKGAFIVEYTGKKLPWREADANANRYHFELNSRWTIDGAMRSNVARYLNHSCRPNAEADVVRGRIIIRARKGIKPGNEITFNYGKDYFDIFLKPKGCRCEKCTEPRTKSSAASSRTATKRSARTTTKPSARTTKKQSASKTKKRPTSSAKKLSVKRSAKTTTKRSASKTRSAGKTVKRSARRKTR